MMIGRNIRTLLVLAVIVALPVLWLFRPIPELPARFAAADCRRVALSDSQSGRPVAGIGDMQLLSDGDTVLVAASDLLALDRNPASAPNGGLYRLSLSRLAAGEPFAVPILSQDTAPGGLFPQALAVAEEDGLLAFVNRDREGAAAIIAGRYRDGAFSPRYTREDAAFCRARDLQFAGEGEMGVQVVLDRASCRFSLAELDPQAATGRVVAVDLAGADAPVELEGGLAEPAGIAGTYVAESRLSRLHDRLDAPVLLPGRPERLSWDNAGGLVAALHPSLPRLLAFRYGFAGSAPTRLVRVDLDRRIEVLFDDPEGALFSAASTGVLSGAVLVAGSGLEPAVLVCAKRGG